MHSIGQIDYQHFVVAYALAAIPARYALERGQWNEASNLELYPAPSDFPWEKFPQAEALNVYANALGAARSDELEKSKMALERLTALKDVMQEMNQAYWAEQTSIQIQSVNAWIALNSEGHHTNALKIMKAAANQEATTEKHAVMPGPLAPARELLGEMLLHINKPEEALKAFELSLEVEPLRFRSVYGAANAANKTGDKINASKYYSELLKIADSSDANRPELEDARAFKSN